MQSVILITILLTVFYFIIGIGFSKLIAKINVRASNLASVVFYASWCTGDW